ncbi:MAG: Zn-ribbon domain-containing OB-fold protein [Promethearchaeota archaeon]
MSENKPITQYNYLNYLNEKKLMGSTCKECNNVDLPARPICSKCLSTRVEWTDLTNLEGTLSTFSCVHVGTTKFVRKGYNMKNPYAFGVVTLDNGAAITGLLSGVDARDPSSIKIGDRFKVHFIETDLNEDGTEKQVDVGFEVI